MSSEAFKQEPTLTSMFQAIDRIDTQFPHGYNDLKAVVIGGGTNLLSYPEYSDVTRAKSFFKVLESKETVRKLVNRDGGMEVTIRIGPENGVPEMNDCSVVTANYRVGDHSSGTLGIIGPTRMNYNRVISVLDFMGRALSEVLADRK